MSTTGPEPSPAADGHLIKIGVAAMDRKARSKPMRNILSRVLATNKFEVVVFGDKAIIDEDIETWPVCDFLITFFSSGFPMDKAIRYIKLRKPVCINDLPLQKVFWDRRLVLAILDAIGVRTPNRVEVNRDGGPRLDAEIVQEIESRLGIKLDLNRSAPEVDYSDPESIKVDGKVLKKPFVEKPVSGEDHNINIYFGNGKGGRRLFRKIGNQSSTLDPDLVHPRTDGSFIYEEFKSTENSEDIKIYTLGPNVHHAETRKSPVVDGVVRRNPDGKEIRYVTQLTDEEREIARKISTSFSQNICGFDILRADGKSYVIDVNGWSFVKGNDGYYDKCADILGAFCQRTMPTIPRPPVVVGQKKDRPWGLKGSIIVFRHADRTPKSKLKFNFKGSDPWSAPFIALLQGRRDEIILRDPNQLRYIADAAEEASKMPGVDAEKMEQLKLILKMKMGHQGLKAQLKPTFGGESGDVCEKLNIVVKWGGEFTHAARHQSRDIGENMSKDLRVMNKHILDHVTIYTSSERRVVATAEIFSAALHDGKKEKRSEPHQLIIRKDLLDDSNAAKDPMDRVKKRLKVLLRHTGQEDYPWPVKDKEPVDIVRDVMEIMRDMREVMKSNWETMDVDHIQSRWCCGEYPFLFRERWDKLFSDWCDVDIEKVDPSRVSELYDSLKYDSLHNRTFLETIFANSVPLSPNLTGSSTSFSVSPQTIDQASVSSTRKKWETEEPSHRLKELYAYAKVLFDLIAPQEYGIEQHEKREIGLLTSLPLLQKIIADLQEARDSEVGMAKFYFTKESHIHTLVNLIKLSSLKLAHRDVLELDYMAYMSFEVYERTHEAGGKEHSVRIALSEGAHGMPLDTSLDAKHALQVLQRRLLIPHTNLDDVISSLEDWGEDLNALKKSTTPYDGFLPVEGDEVFLGKKRPAIDVRHFIPEGHTRPPSAASSSHEGNNGAAANSGGHVTENGSMSD